MPQPDPSELPTGATDAAMGHPNVNIGFLSCFGLIWLPFHVSLNGTGVKASPALELVVGTLASHFDDCLYEI